METAAILLGIAVAGTAGLLVVGWRAGKRITYREITVTCPFCGTVNDVVEGADCFRCAQCTRQVSKTYYNRADSFARNAEFKPATPGTFEKGR